MSVLIFAATASQVNGADDEGLTRQYLVFTSAEPVDIPDTTELLGESFLHQQGCDKVVLLKVMKGSRKLGKGRIAMNVRKHRIRILAFLFIVTGALISCAPYQYGPYYGEGPGTPTASNPSYASDPPFNLSPNDMTYVLDVQDHTPLGIQQLPYTVQNLYRRGYDHVRRQREADFAIEVVLSGGSRDNPNVRVGNALGGALLGAATGAIIGGATGGDAGAGAAIGAAGGGALGAIAPASTPLVRIDVNLFSLHDRTSSQRSTTIDLAAVPPYDAQRVIDLEVTRLLAGLPRR